ncbi:hypothetical protein ACX8XN_17645 [Calditrichota bacterium GD2]
MLSEQQKNNLFKYFMILLYLVTGLFLLYFLYTGWDYYRLPLQEKIRHPQYQNLKPGGRISHGLGIMGSLMMISLLFYSLRKRVKAFRRWGALNRWLNFHIFLGIMGPLFIILHTTFKVDGLVAVSFWSMIAVALSGVFGRFIYVQIPRNIVGIELSKDKAMNINERLKSKIQYEYQLDDQEFVTLEEEIGVHFTSDSFFKVFVSLILIDLILFFRRPRIYKRVEEKLNISRARIKTLVNLTVQQAKLEQRIHFLNQIQQIFHYWHVIHKPFAILMYLIMMIHVGIVVWLGYTWF